MQSSALVSRVCESNWQLLVFFFFLILTVLFCSWTISVCLRKKEGSNWGRRGGQTENMTKKKCPCLRREKILSVCVCVSELCVCVWRCSRRRSTSVSIRELFTFHPLCLFSGVSPGNVSSVPRDQSVVDDGLWLTYRPSSVVPSVEHH